MSRFKFLVATVGVIVLTWLIDDLFLQENSPRDKLDILDRNEPIDQQMFAQTFEQQALEGSHNFAFVEIELPSPKAKPNHAPTKLPKNELLEEKQEARENLASNQMAIEQVVAEQVAIEHIKSDQETRQQQTTAQKKVNDDLLIVPRPELIAQKVSELSALSSINRVIYFPNDTKNKRLTASSSGKSFLYGLNSNANILAYMHQCVGIGIAGLEGENLILLNKPANISDRQFLQGFSQLIRVVSGTMLSNERNLLSVYAPNSSLVRLFPFWFDQTLGFHLAAHLHDQKLKQFSAEYKIIKDSLWLTKVSVNNEEIQKDWLIKETC